MSISTSAMGLSVVSDDWRPRERGARGTRTSRNRTPYQRSGISLYGK